MERERIGYLLAAVTAPLVLFVALLARPQIDKAWENHPAHFWLVLGAAAIATALGWAVSVAARRRRDARLLLISLAFIASSGFLGLHALATPGVLLAGPNAGFELATPFGLVVAGAFAAASSLELSGETGRRVLRAAPLLPGVTRTEGQGLRTEQEADDSVLSPWPSALDGLGVPEELAATLLALADEEAAEGEDWQERLLVNLSCRTAVRRGRPLVRPAMRALVESLGQTGAPAVCPHGSPLLMHVSGSLLEKQFGWT